MIEENEFKVGDVVCLGEHARDVYANRIGGLKVKVLSIDNFKKLARIEILVTGYETNIFIGL